MAKDTFNLNEWVGNKERRLLKEDYEELTPEEMANQNADSPMHRPEGLEEEESEEEALKQKIAKDEFGMDFYQLGEKEKEWVRDEIQNMKHKNSDEETHQEKLQRTFDDNPNYHEDIDTDGYVENMKQPDLQNAIDAIKEVWEEWKSGPATEANQLSYALEDLLNHVRQQLSDFDIK